MRQVRRSLPLLAIAVLLLAGLPGGGLFGSPAAPLTVDAAPAAQAPTSYTILDLGTADGYSAQPRGISAQGAVVGEPNLTGGNGGVRATWLNPPNDAPRDLGTLVGGGPSRASPH